MRAHTGQWDAACIEFTKTNCLPRQSGILCMACVMHLRDQEDTSNGVNAVTLRWNGYLVRALNELVSLTDACMPSDSSVLAKASISRKYSEERPKKKSAGRKRRKYKAR